MAKEVYVHSVSEYKRVYLPWEIDETSPKYKVDENERTWFEHWKMTEKVYQDYINLGSKVKLGSKKGKKEDEKAEVDMMLGTTRMFLVSELMKAWNLEDEQGRELPATPANVKKLPPELVKVWVDDIYEFNPILKNEEEDEENIVIDNEEFSKN